MPTRAPDPDPLRRPVRWLLLDVGGVLEIVDDEAWPSRFRARWAERLGLSEATMTDRLAGAGLPDMRTSSGVQERFWAMYGAALGAGPRVLEEIRADFWDAYCGSANRELVAALAALRGEVGLAILSNSADGAREEEERRFGFAALFDPVCYSHEIGFGKPDRRAFDAALQQMRAAPDDVLFIDNVPGNIEAARQLGLRAHLHVDNDDTISAIHAALRPLPAPR